MAWRSPDYEPETSGRGALVSALILGALALALAWADSQAERPAGRAVLTSAPSAR